MCHVRFACRRTGTSVDLENPCVQVPESIVPEEPIDDITEHRSLLRGRPEHEPAPVQVRNGAETQRGPADGVTVPAANCASASRRRSATMPASLFVGLEVVAVRVPEEACVLFGDRAGYPRV